MSTRTEALQAQEWNKKHAPRLYDALENFRRAIVEREAKRPLQLFSEVDTCDNAKRTTE